MHKLGKVDETDNFLENNNLSKLTKSYPTKWHKGKREIKESYRKDTRYKLKTTVLMIHKLF